MTINIKNEDSIYTVALQGRLDTATSPDLQKELEPILPNAKKVILDLAELEYISSAGLRVVLSTYQTLDDMGKKLIIRHPSEIVLKVFRLTQLEGILTIEA